MEYFNPQRVSVPFSNKGINTTFGPKYYFPQKEMIKDHNKKHLKTAKPLPRQLALWSFKCTLNCKVHLTICNNCKLQLLLFSLLKYILTCTILNINIYIFYNFYLCRYSTCIYFQCLVQFLELFNNKYVNKLKKKGFDHKFHLIKKLLREGTLHMYSNCCVFKWLRPVTVMYITKCILLLQS